MKLPDRFWHKNEFQGGVELSLMSTTANRDIALHYSKGQAATIFEVEVGRVDIGGQLSFLSQYKLEDEYLVGPFACLEVKGTPRIEITPHGQVTVVPLRMNVNLKSLTCEELLERRKNLHIAMILHMQEELFRNLSDVSQCMQEQECQSTSSNEVQHKRLPVYLDSLISAIKKEFREIVRFQGRVKCEQYNDNEEYKKLVENAIQCNLWAKNKIDLFKRWCSRKQFDQLQFVIETPLEMLKKKSVQLR